MANKNKNNKQLFNIPKDDSKYKWTNHVKGKMVYYGISESLIKRIVRFPKRIEEGVAPKTTAVMQAGSNKKKPTEIWVMYRPTAEIVRPSGGKLSNSVRAMLGLEKIQYRAISAPGRKIIISAWRYPGVSQIGKKIPIPDEILQELESIL